MNPIFKLSLSGFYHYSIYFSELSDRFQKEFWKLLKEFFTGDFLKRKIEKNNNNFRIIYVSVSVFTFYTFKMEKVELKV